MYTNWPRSDTFEMSRPLDLLVCSVTKNLEMDFSHCGSPDLSLPIGQVSHPANQNYRGFRMAGTSSEIILFGNQDTAHETSSQPAGITS